MKSPTVENVLDALSRAGRRLPKAAPSPAPAAPRPQTDGPTFAGVCDILESMASTYLRYAQRCQEMADSLRERDPSLKRTPTVERRVREPALSKRQREVRDLLRDGFKVGEIAQELQISESTVRTYVQDVYKLYRVHSQVEFIRIEGARRREADALPKGIVS